MTSLFALLGLLAAAAQADPCGLQHVSALMGATLASQSHALEVSMGGLAGISQSSAATLGIGPQYAAAAAYKCFLSSELGVQISAYPGSKSTKHNVPTAAPSMTLEWTATNDTLPLTFSVFMGTSPIAPTAIVNGLSSSNSSLGRVSGIGPAAYSVEHLTYFTPYYWRIMAADQFGRTAESPVYTFSIAPATDHLIAAPNPFQPGSNPTTLMFLMDAPGAATMEVFSLPDARSVLKISLGTLGDGVNTFTYDGRDSGGHLLPNGVYVVRISKNGALGNGTETTKIVVAR